MCKKEFTLIETLVVIAILAAICFPVFCGAEEGATEKPVPLHRAFTGKEDVFFINLGDYAKGDGSDETEAIQRAIDAIPSYRNWPESDPKKGGVLHIPRPEKFYGISKTLDFQEKCNITIECESPAFFARLAPTPMYFKWIGEKGDQPMFSFNTVIGARVINLSLDGRSPGSVKDLYEATGEARAKRLDSAYDKPTATGIVGIYIGPTKEQEIALGDYPGIAHTVSFDHLTIKGCDVGMWVGGYSKQSDTSSLRAANVSIGACTSYGIVVNSTMATIQFDNLCIDGSGKSNIRLYGGEVGLSQYVGTGNSKDMVADIELRGGGLRVLGAWSETYAPFIKAQYEWVMYPTFPRVLIDVKHGCPYGGNASIDYDQPAPLNLIGCVFRNDILAGPKSGSILAMGVTFMHPEAGFGGEGITKYGRLVRIGTAALESNDPSRAIVWGVTAREAARVAPEGTSPCWNDPYIMDRRNWPGTEPPKDGVWAKGDGIINIDPDINVSTKAWRGWICIEAGEPGEWRPYGAIGE